MFRRFLLGAVLMMTCLGAVAQDESQLSIPQYMKMVRAGAQLPPPPPAEGALEPLLTYTADTLPEVRRTAYYFIGESARAGKGDAFVVALLNGMNDEDPGVRASVMAYLERIGPAAYNEKAENLLTNNLQKWASAYPEMAMIGAGVLGQKARPALLPLVSRTENLDHRWILYLALSRAGDDNATRKVVNAIGRQQVSDDWVYDLAPDLVYTRQKAAFDLLVKELNSQQKLCSPAAADLSGNIVCGYRILEMVAPHIQDFPIKTDVTGDLDTDDYPKALETARQWFSVNPDYVILQ
ncbi:hypothetical protein AB9P05_21375 [Roseivirga sp. BDSF3-8]|uniref:hypothetical protein n=1 Tax=Roseivirga sp. BDSF3-8 TaxID=3241598 RepID=UPI0035322F94